VLDRRQLVQHFVFQSASWNCSWFEHRRLYLDDHWHYECTQRKYTEKVICRIESIDISNKRVHRKSMEEEEEEFIHPL
jgi:hypothetical protein